MKYKCIIKGGLLLLGAMIASGSAFAVTGTYVLGVQLTGRTIEVPGGSKTDGAALDQWQYTGATSQQWAFTDLGGGYSEIVNVNSGLAMTVSGNSVVQSAYTGSNNQQWAFTVLANGWYKVINRGNGKSLDIVSANGADGAAIDTYAYSGTPQQTFFLVSPANWGKGLVNLAAGGDIQTAVDQVAIMGGGTVNLAAGTFTLPEPGNLRIRSNITLTGASTASSIITVVTGQASVSMIQESHSGMLNITLQNFTLDGGTSQNNGIGIAGVTNMNFLNLEVKNMGGDGIDSSYNTNFTMTNCEVDNGGGRGFDHNYYCRSCDYMTLTNCRSFNSPGGCGFKFSAGSHWLFQGCIAAGNSFDGMCIQSTPDTVTIQNCIFNDNGEGSNIGATNLLINYCTWNNNQGYGVMTTGGSGTISNTTSTNNGSANFEIHGGFSWQDSSLNNSNGNMNGTYEICPLLGAGINSGPSVEVLGNSTADGASIDEWTYNGGDNQKWTITNVGGSNFSVINVHSGKAMEVPGASTVHGALLDQLTYSGATNQQWTIADVTLPVRGLGCYTFSAVHDGLNLDMFGNQSKNGTKADQWPSNGQNNQRFYLFRR